MGEAAHLGRQEGVHPESSASLSVQSPEQRASSGTPADPLAGGAADRPRSHLAAGGSLDAASGEPPIRAFASLTRETRMKDIALRMLNGQSAKEIARAYDITPQAVYATTTDPAFAPIYTETRETIYGDLDRLMRDEKANDILRREAVVARATTVLVDLLEKTGDALKATPHGAIKPAMIQATAQAVKTALDRRPSEEERSGDKVAASVKVNVEKALIIQGAIAESGVDLSDLFETKPVNLEPANGARE